MSTEAANIFATVIAMRNPESHATTRWKFGPKDRGSAASALFSELSPYRFDARDMLSKPVAVFSLGRQPPSPTTLDQSLEFDITRAGDAFGVALWIGPGQMDVSAEANDPGANDSEHAVRERHQVMFPWPEIVSLVSGDNVRVNLKADLPNEECDWYWDSLIRKVEGGGIQGIRYRQYTVSPLSFLNGQSK